MLTIRSNDPSLSESLPFPAIFRHAANPARRSSFGERAWARIRRTVTQRTPPRLIRPVFRCKSMWEALFQGFHARQLRIACPVPNRMPVALFTLDRQQCFQVLDALSVLFDGLFGERNEVVGSTVGKRTLVGAFLHKAQISDAVNDPRSRAGKHDGISLIALHERKRRFTAARIA